MWKSQEKLEFRPFSYQIENEYISLSYQRKINFVWLFSDSIRETSTPCVFVIRLFLAAVFSNLNLFLLLLFSKTQKNAEIKPFYIRFILSFNTLTCNTNWKFEFSSNHGLLWTKNNTFNVSFSTDFGLVINRTCLKPWNDSPWTCHLWNCCWFDVSTSSSISRKIIIQNNKDNLIN